VGAIGTHLLVHCRVGRGSSRGRRFTSSSWQCGRRSLLFCFEGVSPSTSPSGLLWVFRPARSDPAGQLFAA
jgi:hypothetical protein